MGFCLCAVRIRGLRNCTCDVASELHRECTCFREAIDYEADETEPARLRAGAAREPQTGPARPRAARGVEERAERRGAPQRSGSSAAPKYS